jgi:hypothetical protein
MIKGNIISEWIKSDIPLTREMFSKFTLHTRKLNPSEQILFLKKVFNEIAKDNISLSISDLSEIKTFDIENFQEFGEPKEIDYTLDLIIHTLKLINSKGNFPNNYREVYSFVNDIADYICEYLQNNIEYLNKVNLIFDDCLGRTAIASKKKDDKYVHLRNNNYKVYKIYQGYTIINPDNNGWGQLYLHYEDGIYAKGQTCMIEIVNKKNNRDGTEEITYGNNIKYKDKFYPFEWKKDDNIYLITPDTAPVNSCEGRKSPANCEMSGKEFWWCYGRKCFKANQINHTISEWEKYSLRDFINILKLPFNEIGYYTFVSEINRLNRILDRIKCNDCNKILRPSKQTNFGFYRVSHFRCNNDKCKTYLKDVYLTHCLNSKCTNVIDDRVAKRCPNGFIICDKCGSCCSNEQFARRIESLKTNNQIVSKSLSNLFDKKLGHWEKAECYCYKCQNEMTENKGGEFKCNQCKIYYDRFKLYLKSYKDFKLVREEKRRASNTK